MDNIESTRRKFLKTSSLLAGGVLTASMMRGANYFSASDDVIKVALVGCGGRGSGATVQALLTKQNVKLVALADAFRDRLDACYEALHAEDFSDWSGAKGNVKNKIDIPEERKFVGLDAYIKAIQLADVVILATPPGFRPIHFEECVKQGKHVFMEKPVATDPAGILKVLETAKIAKAKKLNVVVGLQFRYQNGYRELVRRKNLAGDIISCQTWYYSDAPLVKKRKNNQTEMEYQLRNWYHFTWLSGDIIPEQQIHNLDVINWFKDGYPVKAQGMGGREVRRGKDVGNIYDHHFVEFEYADGSILNSQCRQMPGTMDLYGDLLLGTKGKIHTQDARISTYNGKVLYQFDKSTDNNPYQAEHDGLFAAVARGEHKFWDAENGAKSSLTAIMGRMATYSGQLIKWDQALNSGIDLQPKVYDWNALPQDLPDEKGNYAVAIPGVTKYS